MLLKLSKRDRQNDAIAKRPENHHNIEKVLPWATEIKLLYYFANNSIRKEFV